MEVETPIIVAKSSAKHWFGTIPNYTPLDIMCFAVSIQPLADYYVFGKEVGAGGLKHLQFFVSFKARKTLVTVKKLIQTQGSWFVKYQKSTMKNVSDYCKKGMTLFDILVNICTYRLSHTGDQSHEEWDAQHQEGPNFGINADFIEWGILPKDQTVAGREVIAANYEETLTLARSGKLEDINAEHYLKVFSQTPFVICHIFF